MYIPDCIPERHLKNLEGDCIRIYLYRLMFGEKIQAASIAAALNLEVEIVEHCIEKLILLGLWNTRIQEYQKYLQNIDLKTILEDDTALISSTIIRSTTAVAFASFLCNPSFESTYM